VESGGGKEGTFISLEVVMRAVVVLIFVELLVVDLGL